MKLYSIRDWGNHFENNRSRELKKIDWVPFPNKQDGDGYTYVLSQKDGESLYGAWCSVVQVASRCDVRGTLLRDTKKPHDASSLSRITRFSVETIQRMLDVCSSDEVQWMEVVEYETQQRNPAFGCDLSTAAVCDPKTASGCLEGNGMEGNGTEGTFQPSVEVPVGGKPPIGHRDIDEQLLKELTDDPTLKNVDIDGELASMKRWCRERGKKPTRRRLINWVNTAAAKSRRPASSTTTNGNGASDFWKNSKELELVDGQIRAIELSSPCTATGLLIPDDKLENYNSLRARRKELKRELGLLNTKPKTNE